MQLKPKPLEPSAPQYEPEQHEPQPSPPPPYYSQQYQPHQPVDQAMMVWATAGGALYLGEYPQNVQCQYCHQQVLTMTRHRIGGLAWLLFLGLFCLLFLVCCCCLAFIPCCMNDCKDVEHVCPSCQRVVGIHRRM